MIHMSSLLYFCLVILGIVFVIAFFTALWRTLHDAISKILNKVLSSAWGIVGLALFIWFLWHYKK
jgi:hypothetical protein